MPADSWRFAARWSRSVGIITIAVTIAVVIVDVVLARAAYATWTDKASHLLPILGALLVTGILGVIALFAPWSYAVRTDGIVVNRLGWPVVIAYEDIQELRPIDSREIGFAWRTFGSGGFLGWFGWFHSRPLGGFLAYATNQRDMILVTKTDGTRIVISPHPPDAFLEAARKNREQAA